MNRKTIWLLAAVMAMGLIAAGCDDDDDGGDALTKEEFVAQGNAICEKGNAEINAAADEAFSGKQPNPAAEEAFVTDTLVPSVQGQIDDIRDLGIPEGDEDTVNGFLDKAELILQDLKEDPASIDDGDPFAPVNQELADYGLTTCAEGG
jgi:hypothetical protein